MAEDLSNSNGPDSRGVLSGIAVTLFSSFIAVAIFALFFSLAYQKKLPEDRFRFVAVILQIAAAIVAVGMTQFLSRKIQGDKLSLMQAFLGGWMAALVLGMLVSFFYSIFARITGTQTMPKGAFAMILMLFSLMGLIISLILSFLFKK